MGEGRKVPHPGVYLSWIETVLPFSPSPPNEKC